MRRREFLRVFGLGLAASALLPPGIRAESPGLNDSLHPSYKLDGVKLTPEDLITSYNNFYEWGLAKDQPKELANHGWKTRPWSVEIGGLCVNPRKLDVDELIQLLGPIEHRNYRHRCVEAWSMVMPWDGFALAKLVELAQPTPDAKYVKFTEQPRTLWNQLAPNEYGFYANVNPNVDHPRWSQKSERVIGASFFAGKQPTLMFNGYEKQVAHLYAGMDLRKNF